MNELEFLDVLNEIDDELILDAKKPLKARSAKASMFAKFAVAAAVICLLSLTVFAVSFSVRVWNSNRRVPIYDTFPYDMGVFSPSSKVVTVDYSLQAQNIQLPTQWVEDLTEQWKAFEYDYTYFHGIDLRDEIGSRMNFGGISALEHLLGISLVSSPELEESFRGAYVSLVITDWERASTELREEGKVYPDGVRVYLPLSIGGQGKLPSEVVEYCCLNIYIPLTDSFAESYRSHAILSGDGEQDLKQSRYTSPAGIQTHVLANEQSSAEPMKAYGAWEYKGIGYLLEMKTHFDTTADPTAMIIPYFENLED